MTITDYADKKYLKGAERDSFFRRWKGYDTKLTPVDLFRKLTAGKNNSFISDGIQMLGELEIHEHELEQEVIDYCRGLISENITQRSERGIIDLVESILLALGEIGSIDTLKFLQGLIFNGGEWFLRIVNPEYVLSACQYSFYRINQRELANFFIKVRSVREIPVKTQAEIDALRKLNPKYAEFQQFLFDKYKEYEGGGLN